MVEEDCILEISKFYLYIFFWIGTFQYFVTQPQTQKAEQESNRKSKPMNRTFTGWKSVPAIGYLVNGA